MFFVRFTASSQLENPYHINGDAYKETCNCYILTTDVNNRSGSVWNKNKIDLSESFDFKFNVYLGCDEIFGADGIAFVLQPINTSIGTVGGGMGYEGVSPSIGVLIDTWTNSEDNDPTSDHITIHKNGIIDHSPSTDVSPAVTALANGGNIEDCKWHIMRITWDAETKTLSTEIDGFPRNVVNIDMVPEIFGGDPMVFWGFTAATGGQNNLQRFCTSLEPKFILPQDQLTCFPNTVQFIDSSVSFGKIDKWFWDFGDGDTSSLPSPSHDYKAPGNYEVKMKILGSNGCLSEAYSQTVVMGTKPDPAIGFPRPICLGQPVSFFDSSSVQFGTINKWHWKIESNTYEDERPAPQTFNGSGDAELWVETKEGCISEKTSVTFVPAPVPAVDFQASDICVTESPTYSGSNIKPSVDVLQWAWNFGDGTSVRTFLSKQEHRFAKGGSYEVQLNGISKDGCISTPVERLINVYETNAFAGNDTIITADYPFTLAGSGGEFYKWSPSYGLSADNIANPVAILNNHTSFILTAYTDFGCATKDTVNVRVYKGPAFYVPSAFTPNGDGHNDRFNFIAVGMNRIETFQLFNRYGQLVFSSSGIKDGWDGRLAGIPQQSGTYVWLLQGTDFNGQIHSQKGTFTLIR
jgi:gliding motility-associated-like protein